MRRNRLPKRHFKRRPAGRSFRLEALEPRRVMDAAGVSLVDDAYEARQNGPERILDVLANDTLPIEYADAGRITSVSYGSQGGRLAIAADGLSLLYTPPADVSGTETFDYYLDNQFSATVSVQLNSPLRDNYYYHEPDGNALALDVLANDPFWDDYTGEGKITLLSAASQGSQVSIASDGKSLVYQPKPGAVGKDAFIYIVDDVYAAEVLAPSLKSLLHFVGL